MNPRNLLAEVLANWDDPHSDPIRTDGLMERIREYLAEPKVKREALSEHAIRNEHRLRFGTKIGVNFFLLGVRFAEKHHGIGGGE